MGPMLEDVLSWTAFSPRVHTNVEYAIKKIKKEHSIQLTKLHTIDLNNETYNIPHKI